MTSVWERCFIHCWVSIQMRTSKLFVGKNFDCVPMDKIKMQDFFLKILLCPHGQGDALRTIRSILCGRLELTTLYELLPVNFLTDF